jgi:class 3 adenylate cyclase
MSSATRERIQRGIRVESPGRLTLKGKDEPVEVFELLELEEP